MWSAMKARLSHRLAMHMPVTSVRLANEQPMVSFTFDDVPRSAVTNGAAVLDEYGASGTFYVSGGTVGTRTQLWDLANADDLAALHAKGHELACHTYSHRSVYDMNAPAMASDIGRNRGYLEGLSPSVKVSNFAYPFGLGSFAGKRQLQALFKSCRSIVPGINQGDVDLQFLKSVPLVESRLDRKGIDRAMDAAVESNGWLIFYTHDVAETPSPYGCSLQFLEHALDAADRRNISITNVANALKKAVKAGSL
jgi:peptidoglycan/xylan/chitin deacetylase (PgdA/CDA1 family)